MSGAREISRWECPGCGWWAEIPEDTSGCECDYSGGMVEVWYVAKGAHLAALSPGVSTDSEEE